MKIKSLITISLFSKIIFTGRRDMPASRQPRNHKFNIFAQSFRENFSVSSWWSICPRSWWTPSTRPRTTGLPEEFPVTQSSEMNDCDWLGKYYSEPGGPVHQRRHQVWHDLTHPHVSNCLLCHPFLLPEPARCTGLQISLAQFRTFPNFPWN